MSSSLPPYLTSGASSRSHHSLLVKLHEAKSDQEEDEILEKEIVRQKELMSAKGQSTARLSESLIVLLHVAMLRHGTTTDLDFALVHALHLADSGRTIQEKRIGYLFLQERLPPEHELALMLINTIRKDLSCSSHSRMVLALHMTVKMPSKDLAPAVTPLLTSKALLKHKLPAIRQRALQAICALHLNSGDELFPLSMSKLVRLLTAEEDEAVLSVILGTMKLVLEGTARSIGSRDEAIFLSELVIGIASGRLEQGGQIPLQCIGVLRQIISSPHGKDCGDQISSFLLTALPLQNVDESAGGVLLEICHLLAKHEPSSQVEACLLAQLSRGLRPSHTMQSTSHIPYTPKANTHVLVIRCLYILPVQIWDGQLGEAEMGTMMDGLNSPDDTVRRSTLRLLQRLSPELLVASFSNYLQALKTSSSLSLPLNVPTSLGEKTVAGRLETSGRALEVIEIMYCNQSPANNQFDLGDGCAHAFVDIVAALNEGVIKSAVSTKSRGGVGDKGQVWEAGLRKMVFLLDNRSSEFTMGFSSTMIESRIGSATLAVVRCTTLCKITLDSEMAQSAVQVLLEDLADFGSPVQEIILVALVTILSETEHDQKAVIEMIRQVQLEAGKYIKKRCGQVVDLIQQNLLDEVMQATDSRSIPDILEAMAVVHKRWCRSQRHAAKSSPHTPASPSRSITGGPSSLRYDAYELPSSSVATSSVSRHTHDPRSSARQVSKSKHTPGDSALFDADEEDSPVARDRAGRRGKLRGLSIVESSSQGLDPSTGDEARTPTMRESRHVGI